MSSGTDPKSVVLAYLDAAGRKDFEAFDRLLDPDVIFRGPAASLSGALEVEAPHKVVQTRKYEWDHPNLGRRETTVNYRFDPIATGTRVTVRHEGFAGLAAAAEEHAAGWERVLGWLAGAC